MGEGMMIFKDILTKRFMYLIFVDINMNSWICEWKDGLDDTR
jgi:hypothetical protein